MEAEGSGQTPEKVVASGTVLAFDFGLKRIGVAVGDLTLRLAHPLVTIDEESNERRFAAIAALVNEWRPSLFVVGVPAHLGERTAEHELAARCRRFARQLEGRYRIPARLVDETLSSAGASQALAQAGLRGRRQKPVLDQVAAQTILQAFFDATPQLG